MRKMSVLPLVQFLNDIIENPSPRAFLICHAHSAGFQSPMCCLPRGYKMATMAPDVTTHT